jgi:hypothetical protein
MKKIKILQMKSSFIVGNIGQNEGNHKDLANRAHIRNKIKIIHLKVRVLLILMD